MEQEISASDGVCEDGNAAFPFVMLNIVKHLIADLHVADKSFTCVQDDKYNSVLAGSHIMDAVKTEHEIHRQK
ncbi:MAG: hypothetical protein V4456_01630 [Bacteroidota bacterium]